MKSLRNDVRWWLHGMSDLAFEQSMRKGFYPALLSRLWLWLAGRLDLLALWIGGPV